MDSKKPKHKFPQLNKLASEMIGDGKTPNLFFVSYEGNIITVSISFHYAYEHWKTLANMKDKECSLEDRKHGTIASIEQSEDNPHKLIKIDESFSFGLTT